MKKLQLLLQRYRKQLLFSLGALFILGGAGAYLFFMQPKNKVTVTNQLQQLTSPQAEKKARTVVEEVGKLMRLPEQEIPSVATITDLNELPNHEFYRYAKVGDKLLIYSSTQKIILYRPSENIIIDVAPVEFASEKSPQFGEVASASTSASASPSADVVDSISPAQKRLILTPNRGQ